MWMKRNIAAISKQILKAQCNVSAYLRANDDLDGELHYCPATDDFDEMSEENNYHN